MKKNILSPFLKIRLAGLARWKACLYLISEWESLVQRPGGKLFWRNKFLRAHGVNIQGRTFFGNGFRLYKHGRLTIGRDSCFGENCGLYVHGDVKIGANFLAAPGLTINSGDHSPENLEPRALPIVIGDRVWCGVNVTILGGATIGDDCVIGANTLVRGTIPSGSVAVGAPAKVIKSLERKTQPWRVYDGNESD